MKDNFSSQSDKYAKFRPKYPSAFFDYLNSLVSSKLYAWDCGTGNGQIAKELSKTFTHIFATDISRSQIENAERSNNITYSVQPAEKTNFQNQQFDLIIVAQAIHWFNFNEFYKETSRTAKVDSIICIVGYSLIKISQQIDKIISSFYTDTIGEYWDKERKYIDEEYKTIPFPFDEIKAPKFENTHQWNLDHLIGYLNTWSAVKHYVKKNKNNPTQQLKMELQKHWDNNELKEVKFPILLRIGKIKTSQ